MTIREKIKSKRFKALQWDEARAQEILEYYIPRKAKWDKEKQCFYFFDNGMGWGLQCGQKLIKRKDRRFWKKFACGFGGEIRKYLIEKFELKGFIKEVFEIEWNDTEIIFKKT